MKPIIILCFLLCSCSSKIMVNGYEVKHRTPINNQEKAYYFLAFIGGFVIVNEVWSPVKK